MNLKEWKITKRVGQSIQEDTGDMNVEVPIFMMI